MPSDAVLLVDLVLAVTAIEAIALAAYHHASRRGVALPDVLANLAAGVCLLLALRGALSGAAWAWIAFWLAAAGIAHTLDLWRRWPQTPNAQRRYDAPSHPPPAEVRQKGLQ
jgi:hypothetical protein